jgi:hypothetical protein
MRAKGVTDGFKGVTKKRDWSSTNGAARRNEKNPYEGENKRATKGQHIGGK